MEVAAGAGSQRERHVLVVLAFSEFGGGVGVARFLLRTSGSGPYEGDEHCDCSDLPHADPRIVPAFGRPPVDCSAPSQGAGRIAWELGWRGSRLEYAEGCRYQRARHARRTGTMKDSGAASPADRPVQAIGGRVLLLVLVGGHAVFHWIAQSLVVVLPEIQETFSLSAVGVGGVLSIRELATGAVKLPGGLLADAWWRHRGWLLAGCLAVGAMGTLVIGVSTGYALLAAGIVTVAVTHSIWHLPASSSLSDHFRRRRGAVLAVHGVGGSTGDVLGPVVTGALLAFLTWRDLLSIYGVAAVGVALLGFRILHRLGGPDSPATRESNRLTTTVGHLLRNPVLWVLALVYGLRGMALVGLVTVLPLYMDNDLAMSPASRGLHIGLLIVIGLVAKPVAGHMSDRLGRKQVLVPGLVWSCLAALALVMAGEGVSITIVVLMLGLFLYPDQPVLIAAVFDRIGRESANTGLGMVSSLGALPAMASPLVAGAIYDAWGFDRAAYYIAGLFAAAAVVVVLLPGSRARAR